MRTTSGNASHPSRGAGRSIAVGGVVSSLLLIRHAPAQPEPDLPPADWGLGRDGLRAVMALGDLLPPRTRRIVSASRADARETARVLGSVGTIVDSVLLDERLDEVTTPMYGLDEDPELVERYLAGERMAGWEDPDVALQRFNEAISFARRSEIGARVVVTHGVVLSLWLAPRVGVAPFVLWSGLRSPDVWSYDPASNAVSHVIR